MLPSPAPEFFSWTFTGAPIRIELALSIVEPLRREAVRSDASGTGGVLLGRSFPGRPPAVRITGFRPVPPPGCDRDFAAAIRELRGSSAAVPVGLYRTHIREEVSMDDDDFALIAATLLKPTDVFLAIRPDGGGEATAGFFFWDCGRIHREYSFLEFPLDPDQLRE